MTMEGLILLVKMKFHGQFWRAGDGTQRQKKSTNHANLIISKVTYNNY